MSLIREYECNEVEYQKLKVFCEMCNKVLAENNAHKMVYTKSCYFDYGADWKYTALITEDLKKDKTWQSVSARDYETIVASDSFSEIEAWAYYYAEELIKGNICVNVTF